MTDVSVHECVNMVHPVPDGGSRPVEDPPGGVDRPGGMALPTPPPISANNKAESSTSNTGAKPRREEKPVDDGRAVRETQPRRESARIHRYSPLGVPKPHQTARVVRMVERARKEFEKTQQQSSPYHPKHARPAIPTSNNYQSVQMGYETLDGVVRDDVLRPPPSRLCGQSKHRANVGAPPGHEKPPSGRVKTHHDRVIDAEFNRDVSQALVIHGGRALGLDRSRCETSGLKALVEKNIASFETQSDAMKLCCLLVAKKLNQLTERWVGGGDE